LQFLRQILYWPPFNAFLRAFLKLIPGLPDWLRIPPCGIISVPLINGRTLKLKTNQTCHVTAVLEWEGSSAYEFSDVFQDLFPEIRCFFDVGSNIGYYTVMGGVCNPDLEIHAFDPSPGPFTYLRENIQLNGLQHAKARQLALSDAAGIFSFHIAWNKKFPWLKYNSLGGSGHLSHVRENPTLHTVEAEVLTLDSYAEKEAIQHLDLIKLDVEEAEHLVLAGATESIRKFRPVIVCEVFSGEMLQKIRDQILSQEYLAFRFDEKSRKLIKENLDELSAVNQIENYFFVPAERISLLKKHIG
jgi:FkbM family methyltransferase